MWSKNHSRSLAKGYKHHVDEDVKGAILDFHARTILMRPTRIPSYYVDPSMQAVIVETSLTEEILEPHLDEVIPLEKPPVDKSAKAPRRARSAKNFAPDRKLSDAKLKKIISTSLCRIRDDGIHRPYASAGGLYPVTVFLHKFDSRKGEFPGGTYHLLANSRLLQRRSCNANGFDEKWLYDYGHLNRPTFSLIYVLNIERATFKYSYRGYRHGVIEVGLMAQAVESAAVANGAISRCFSGLNEPLLNRYLDLSCQVYLPMLVQQIGIEAT